MQSIDNPLSKTDLRRIWDTAAPHYHVWELIEDVLLRTKRQRGLLMQQARGEVLDVACGTGRNLAFLDSTCEITGVDLSYGMLMIAQEKARLLGLRAAFQVMDAERLAFPDATFDTVVSTQATCTISDPVAALREMGRVCRADGRILLLEHGRSTWGPLRWYQQINPDLFYGGGCRWNQETQELVHAAGLTILSAYRVWLGVFHVIVAQPPNR